MTCSLKNIDLKKAIINHEYKKKPKSVYYEKS